MNDQINILQFNIRGIVSKDTQAYKCPKLYNLMKSKQIDIVLLQEWCATVREDVAEDGTNSACDATLLYQFHQGSLDYYTHFHSTECAILYHKDLCVTLDRPKHNANRPLFPNPSIMGIIPCTGSVVMKSTYI